VELVRILLQHPGVALELLTSEHFVGKRLSEVYPGLFGKCDLFLETMATDVSSPRFELAFAALPHGVSMDVVAALVESGKRVIDLSADFRLHDPGVYQQWYRPHRAPHLLGDAVYGLTEIHRRHIPKARLIAVPGCYPTGTILGLAPLFAKRLVKGTVLIDAKSGVTGAGRTNAVEYSFSEVNENFKAYNVGVHRHTPEIEQELEKIAQASISVLFAPHLIPISRGILTTMYVELKSPLREDKVARIYRNFYRDAPFIRLLPSGSFPEVKEVRGTNDCAIGFRYEPRSRRLVIITAIDNLVKGAAGQAVQNMNLMYGFSEVEGLRCPALVP
jgi:N-acetyl-gamma-glutamyl-phosphate reductase